MWELGYKERWVANNWCLWTVVLEKTPESPLGCKEIQPVHPKGVQSWVFIERTDIEAETPILWPPHAKSWLILKTPWCWERLRAGGEGDNRGLDCWMASPAQCTWVWVNSKSWWCTGRPGVLWFTGSQRIRHDWATELKWSDAYRVWLWKNNILKLVHIVLQCFQNLTHHMGFSNILYLKITFFRNLKSNNQSPLGLENKSSIVT